MLTSSKVRYVSGWKPEASTANASQDDRCCCGHHDLTSGPRVFSGQRGVQGRAFKVLNSTRQEKLVLSTPPLVHVFGCI